MKLLVTTVAILMAGVVCQAQPAQQNYRTVGTQPVKLTPAGIAPKGFTTQEIMDSGAQTEGYEVFLPIAKYLAQGNSDALYAWFAENLDLSVIAESGDCSRSQARQILKAFFESYTPRSFEITHTAGRANMKYALGNLSAGGESFLVTIFVGCKDGTFRIQQLKIERS